MNKFQELAAKIRAGQTEMDQEADSLSVEVDETLTAFRAAAGQHRSMLGSAREGVQAMQEAASGLIGHNGAPLDATPKPSVLPLPSPVTSPPQMEGANSSPQPSQAETSTGS